MPSPCHFTASHTSSNARVLIVTIKLTRNSSFTSPKWICFHHTSYSTFHSPPPPHPPTIVYMLLRYFCRAAIHHHPISATPIVFQSNYLKFATNNIIPASLYRNMSSYSSEARSAFLSAVKNAPSGEFVDSAATTGDIVKALEGLKLQSEQGQAAPDLKELDTKLSPVTYISNSYKPSIEDVELYLDLHPTVSQLESSVYYTVPSVTRYFDHIQHLDPVVEARSQLPDTPFTVKQFDLDNMPPLERKVEVKEKKAKKGGDAAAAPAAKDGGKNEKSQPKVAAPAGVADASKGEASVVPVEGAEGAAAAAAAAGTNKKEKKQKEKKEKKPQPAAPEPTGPMPSMIDLRVGKVLEVMKHPDAESLYIEKIDLGEETGPRTVCSGLVNYMKPEQIQDQYVIVVCNLKPATMRGVKSFAMLLCASSADGKDAGIEFVKPPPGSQPGDRVYFEGEKYENQTPEAQLNPKRKVFEAIQPVSRLITSHNIPLHPFLLPVLPPRSLC